ncbi:hypothetical protein [Arthrobacter rhombi]|uniref:hypothetical protein n=1 Tax=Arthrobacter rhombi TaxID=71253 RepID=UPI003FD62D09
MITYAIEANKATDFLKDQAEKIGSGTADLWDKTAGKVGDVISFAEDPLKAIFQATRNGAEGLATELLPALSKATEPDLSADFFIKAYAISFAVSIMVWGVLLIFQFLAVASGKQAGADFVDTVFMRSMVFFVGALFGPWVGVFLVKFFGSMSTSLIDWGVGSSSDKMLESMNSMLEVQPSAIPGGVIVGILLMICMILGFLLVVVMLAIMLVTLYLTGVVLPLGLVWFASGKHDAMAKKIPVLWLCLLASHPLLFFLMGFSFNMIAEAADWMKWSGGLETLMGLVAAVVAMAIAGMSPILLMKFAPVLPSGAGQQSGPSMSAPEKSYGAQDMKEAKEEMRTSKPGTEDAGQDEGESGGGGGGATGGGGLMNKLKELGGGSGPEEAESAPTGGGSGAGKAPSGLAEAGGGKSPASMNDVAAGGGGGEKAGAEAGAGKAMPKAPGAGAGAGEAAGAGAGAGGAGAAAGGAGAAEGMAAAGAAETGTGVGAVVGVPTLLAAGAMAAAEKTAEVGKEVSQEATRMGEAGAGYAAGDMRDDEEAGGK